MTTEPRAILGARAGRTSTAQTAAAAAELQRVRKRQRLTMVHAFDRALVDLRNGARPYSVALQVAEALDGVLCRPSRVESEAA